MTENEPEPSGNFLEASDPEPESLGQLLQTFEQDEQEYENASASLCQLAPETVIEVDVPVIQEGPAHDIQADLQVYGENHLKIKALSEEWHHMRHQLPDETDVLDSHNLSEAELDTIKLEEVHVEAMETDFVDSHKLDILEKAVVARTSWLESQILANDASSIEIQQEITSLEEELAQTNRQLESYQADMDEYIQKIQEVHHEVRNHRRINQDYSLEEAKLLNAESELLNLTKLNESLEVSLERVTTSVVMMDKVLLKEGNSLDDLESKVKLMEHEAGVAKQKRKQRREKLVRDQMKVQKMVTDRNLAYSGLQNLKAQIFQSEQDYAVLHGKLTRESAEVTRLKSEIILKSKQSRLMSERIAQAEKMLAKCRVSIQEHQGQVVQKDQQILELNSLISLKENEHVEAARKINSIQSESELFKTQLRQRKEDIQKVSDEVRSLQAKTNKLKGQCEEDRDRRSEIHDNLRRHEQRVLVLKERLVKFEKFRQRLHTKEKELRKLEVETRNLEDQKEITRNVHEWRRLETEDPSKYHEILRFYNQQKKTLKATEELVAHNQKIRESEKHYLKLRDRVGRIRTVEELNSLIAHKEASIQTKAMTLQKLEKQVHEEIEDYRGVQAALELVKDEIRSEKLRKFHEQFNPQKSKTLLTDTQVQKPDRVLLN